MDIGASLWSTANQTTEAAAAITKTRHIGCQWGYSSLVYEPESPMFKFARATGLTVKDWQNVVMVNDRGRRFWNEVDELLRLLRRGDGLERRSGEAQRRRADLGDLRRRCGGAREMEHQAAQRRSGRLVLQRRHDRRAGGQDRNPHQRKPISGAVLEDSIARYNSFVAAGKDTDFNKPTPMHKVQTPPFHAAWSTPILHDALTGLRTNRNAEVVDLRGEVISGLYCAGEAQGGFSQHGLARCLAFGRVAGRHAAQRPAA